MSARIDPRVKRPGACPRVECPGACSMDADPEATPGGAACVRTGPLRNGNPRGNPNLAPRCGAKARSGLPCRAPAMKNGRCQMHGGKSTGPKTAEGMARMAAAHTTHGRFAACGAAERAERRYMRTMVVRTRLLAEALRLRAFLPPGMTALLDPVPAALRAPRYPSQAAVERVAEAGAKSSPWTVREEGTAGGGMAGAGPGQGAAEDRPAVADGGGLGIVAAKAATRKAKVAVARVAAPSAAVAVNWREAERAAARVEAAARLPWRAAIAHARQAKREARAGGPRLSPVQREIAFRAAGGRSGGHAGWRRIEPMDRDGGGGS
jgi:hypothetical protein